MVEWGGWEGCTFALNSRHRAHLQVPTFPCGLLPLNVRELFKGRTFELAFSCGLGYFSVVHLILPYYLIVKSGQDADYEADKNSVFVDEVKAVAAVAMEEKIELEL